MAIETTGYRWLEVEMAFLGPKNNIETAKEINARATELADLLNIAMQTATNKLSTEVARQATAAVTTSRRSSNP